ncbi:MAG: glycosyltransferase [Candidatus Hodarchaeota archaeon]
MNKPKIITYMIILWAYFICLQLFFPRALGSQLQLGIDRLFTDFTGNWLLLGPFIGLVILVLIGPMYFGLHFLATLEPRYHPKEFFHPDISIMIASKDEKALLKQTLDTILDSDYPKDKMQIILIVSGSTDGSAEFFEGYAKDHDSVEWKIISKDMPKKGKPTALNAGLKEVKHDFLVIYDAGCKVTKDTLKILVAPMKDEKHHATIGPVVVENWKTNSLTKGILVDYALISGGSMYGEVKNNLGSNCNIYGKNFCIRTALLRELGGFDEEALTEDLYLTAMLKLHEKKIRFVPKAKAYEPVPETWEILDKQRTRWMGGYKEDAPRIMEKQVGKRSGQKIIIMRNLSMLFLAHVDIFAVVDWVLIPLFFLVGLLAGEWYMFMYVLSCAIFKYGYLINAIRKYGDGHYSALGYLWMCAKIHLVMFAKQFPGGLPEEISWEKTPMILERSKEEIDALASSAKES